MRSPCRVLLACSVLIAVCAPGAHAQPANDTCGAAVPIPSLAYTATAITTLATVSPGDPVPSCGPNDNNVWYVYTAPRPTSLHIDTLPSSYCTTVAVYTGGCGALTEVGCGVSSTPSCTLFKGEVVVPMNGGDTVWIAVSSDVAGGGTLLLSATDNVPPLLKRRSLTEPIAANDASALGGTYGRFASASLRSKRDLAFAADTGGVFARSAGGVLTTIAVAGDPTPAGGTFAEFGEPATNDAGTVVFRARVDGAAAHEGIFASNGGVLTPVVLEGDAAPGGGAYTRFEEDVVVNQLGTVAFRGRSSLFATQDALFVDDGVAPRRVALVGDATPCGSTFRALANDEPRGFGLADTTSALAFVADRQTGGAGIFRDDGVGLAAVACEGDAAPGGGTQRRLGLQPSANGLGEVWFVSEVTGGPSPEVLWRWSAGVLTRELEIGDVLNSGETVEDLHYRQEVDANANGFVGYIARVSPGRDAVVLRDPAAPIGTTVATEGDACPTGGTFGSIDLNVAVSSAGDVAFEASCPNGTATFRAPFGGAPAATGTVLDATAVGDGFRFFDPQVNALGDTVFQGFRTALHTAACPAGVCGPVTTVMANGDAVPGMLGQHFDQILGTTFNGRARLQAFTAMTAGTAGRLAAVIGVVNNLPFTIATAGDPLPGGVGTFGDFPDAAGFGDVAQPSVGKGLAAFYAVIDGHPLGGTAGIYVHGPAGLREVAVEGGVSPTGGIFSAFGRPVLRKRVLAFRALTTLDDCLYGMNAPNGALTTLVCAGDPAPAPVGGTIDLDDAQPSGILAAGVFAATVSGGASSACLFTLRNGTLGLSQCADQPYVLGSYVRDLTSFAASPSAEMDAKGYVYVENDAPGDGGTYRSVIAVRNGKHYPILTAKYERSPVSNGQYVYDPFAPPAMFGKTVAFASALRDGAVSNAVFMGFVP